MGTPKAEAARPAVAAPPASKLSSEPTGARNTGSLIRLPRKSPLL